MHGLSQLTIPHSVSSEPHHTFIKFLPINNTVKSRWFYMPITAYLPQHSGPTVACSWEPSLWISFGYLWVLVNELCYLKMFEFATVPFLHEVTPVGVGVFRIRKSSCYRYYLKEKRCLHCR